MEILPIGFFVLICTVNTVVFIHAFEFVPVIFNIIENSPTIVVRDFTGDGFERTGVKPNLCNPAATVCHVTMGFFSVAISFGNIDFQIILRTVHCNGNAFRTSHRIILLKKFITKTF